MLSRKQRVLGALLGVHAGDALGAPYECSSWADLHRQHPDGIPLAIVGGGPFRWPAGHATDDTDLTRAVLLAYKEMHDGTASDDDDDNNALALALARRAGTHMLAWLEGRWPGSTPGTPPLTCGAATRTGLARFAANARDPRRAGAGLGQAGNGSLMRCIPTALFAAVDDDANDDDDDDDATAAVSLARESALVSAVTHNDPRCVLACLAYNVVARALVDGLPPAAAVDRACAALQPGSALLAAAADSLRVADHPADADADADADTDTDTDIAAHPALRASVLDALERGRTVSVADLAARGPDAASGGPAALPRHATGYVLESLTLAIAAVLDTAGRLPDLLADVVRVGGDTDTNAAIAGGLLGARDGVDAIPLAWRQTLQFGSEFAHIVDQLVPE